MMRIVLGIIAGFVLGWVSTSAAALVIGEWRQVSQAEGAYAMGAIFLIGPVGGLVGAVIGAMLGLRWHRRRARSG